MTHDFIPSSPLQTTKGGIFIPEKAQGKVHEGIVRAVGPGALRDVSAFFFFSILIYFYSSSFAVLLLGKHVVSVTIAGYIMYACCGYCSSRHAAEYCAYPWRKMTEDLN